MALVQLQFNLRLRLDFTEFHFKMAKQQKAIISLGLRLCLHINNIKTPAGTGVFRSAFFCDKMNLLFSF